MSRPSRPLVAGMAVKGSRRRKLPELVTDHIFGHEHWYELVAVMDTKGQADELRKDRRSPRPSSNYLITTGFSDFLRFFQEVTVDERTLPN
jgi:hypothetical protein